METNNKDVLNDNDHIIKNLMFTSFFCFLMCNISCYCSLLYLLDPIVTPFNFLSFIAHDSFLFDPLMFYVYFL